jgi:IS30 family transposase
MKGELKKTAREDLRQKGKKGCKDTGKGETRGKIREMTFIDQHPEEVERGSIPGHGEEDLIISKGHQKVLWVMVERKIRFVQIDLLGK